MASKSAKSKEIRTSSILWGKPPSQLGGLSPTKFVADQSWILTHEHQSPNLTSLSFKAGSKVLALTGYDPERKGKKLSEGQLRKKYL